MVMVNVLMVWFAHPVRENLIVVVQPAGMLIPFLNTLSSLFQHPLSISVIKLPSKSHAVNPFYQYPPTPIDHRNGATTNTLWARLVITLTHTVNTHTTLSRPKLHQYLI